MNHYLDYLKAHSDLTCIIYHDNNIVFTSSEKGVKPILDFYHQTETLLSDYIVVDKIMGRGAIILSKLIHAKKVVTPIISEPAYQLAKEYNMHVTFTTIVPYIINREQNGHCPIETSVINISDPVLGYQTIINTLKNLQKKD
ncbi:MAG: DUF1893 domain-containing protein [Bacilli bacterium]|nr:DUF1893 domain-containing protein [Bacilli bacterium]